MKRADALRRIAELQEAWSLEWGDVIEPPAGMRAEDSQFSADAGATAGQQDDLNEQIKAILARVED